jgi:hypothetical protein
MTLFAEAKPTTWEDVVMFAIFAAFMAFIAWRIAKD